MMRRGGRRTPDEWASLRKIDPPLLYILATDDT
jgi:hypothetical protein